MPTIVPTVTRVPRMHGRPPMIWGSSTIHSGKLIITSRIVGVHAPIPYRTPATMTDVIAVWNAGSQLTHSSTRGSATGLMNSNSTFVSRTIIQDSRQSAASPFAREVRVPTPVDPSTSRFRIVNVAMMPPLLAFLSILNVLHKRSLSRDRLRGN